VNCNPDCNPATAAGGASLPSRGSGPDERASVRDGVDEALVSENRYGVPGAGSADPVLLDEVGLTGQCLVSGQLA
jgi:hypothetical protein